MFSKKIKFIDTTLRDGAQSPLLYDARKYRFNLTEKQLIINALLTIGVEYIELFSPVVGKAENDEIPVLIAYGREINPNAIFLAHSRCNEIDIQAALDAGFDGLNLYFGTSNQATTKGHGKSLSYVRDTASQMLKNLRQQYPDMYLRFSGEDAFRTDIDDLFRVYDAVAPFCNTLGTPDTVGCATPDKVAERIKALRKRYPDKNLECHFHNDRGLAQINALTAIQNGANLVDTAIWGMAERSGINSLTAMLLNLYCENKELIQSYKIENSYAMNVLMGSILKMYVPYNEPVSVTNRTHIAGVHTNAMLKSSSTYEGINLAEFGVTTNELLLGPLSGWNVIQYYLNEFMNYQIADEEAKEITRIFKNRTNEISEQFSPEALLRQIADAFHAATLPVPEVYNEKRIEVLV